MVNKNLVLEALKRTWINESLPGTPTFSLARGQDKEISLLINDIFGGEILKTHEKKGWYFYNRVDGERIDFNNSENVELIENNQFEDIPSTSEEAFRYTEQADYSRFYMKFVRAFEEIQGLKYSRHGYTA